MKSLEQACTAGCKGDEAVTQIEDRLAAALRSLDDACCGETRTRAERHAYRLALIEARAALAEYDTRTPSPASPIRSDTREQAAASPSAVGEGQADWKGLAQRALWYVDYYDDMAEELAGNRLRRAHAKLLAADLRTAIASDAANITEICGRCGKPRSKLCGDDFMPAISSQAPKPAEQFHKLDPRDEAITGIYEKFRVARTDGSSEPGGKHEHCDYFVLDLTHDKHAFGAIHAYATTCRDEYPALANDLLDIAREMAQSGKVPK